MPTQSSQGARTVVLNLWVATPTAPPPTGLAYDHQKTQIFTLQFITLEKLVMKVTNNFMVGAYHNEKNCIREFLQH